MYDVLIVENSLTNTEKVVNMLSQEPNYFRVANISSNYEETIQYLLSKKFEIIILNYSFLEIVEYIENNQLFDYQKSIIVLSENKNIVNTNYLSCFNNESIEYNQLLEILSQFLKYKNSSNAMKNRIREELIRLNYNYSYTGTKYVEDVIFELYKRKIVLMAI